MTITILTLFPQMFSGPFEHSIIKHAQEKKLVTIQFVNIRNFGIGKHKIVDDTPYGGGAGMIMRVDVVHEAIIHAKNLSSSKKQKTILLSPDGKTFGQARATKLTRFEHLILVCGHYEGIDSRIDKFVDEKISIGDYILTGGEIPAMVITDAVIRLLPGVLKAGVTESESFSCPNLEYPQFTRPRVYRRLRVPPVLLTGDHNRIETWRQKQAEGKTILLRPDLITGEQL